jgi:CBS domain-containing protein
MRITDVLRGKGNVVVTVAPDQTVADLLDLLAEHGVGALVVSSDGVAVQGIVSERDVVRRLQRDGAGMLQSPVSEIMTAEVHTAEPDAEIEDLMRLMTERRFRHVPVVVDGALAGIVSIGDIVKGRVDELETEHDQLIDYISSAR